MNSLILAGLVSWLMTLLLIRYNHLHAALSADLDTSGIQKVHTQAVPRIGGVSLFVSVGSVVSWLMLANPSVAWPMLWLLVSAVPAFAGGLTEDLTKRVSPSTRLWLTMLSAVLAFWWLDAGLNRLDVPYLDSWLLWWPLSLCLTVVAVAGVAHAVNIIDGFNGLAGVVSVMILGALAYVAYWVGDVFIWSTCAALAGALLGFLFWNYPRGLIFLGDGGAYFVGFVIGEMSVLLVMRNPEVSPWFPLLLLVYPVFETLFSIYRRKVLRGTSPGLPDGLHLHSLVYKRLVRFAIGTVDAKRLTRRNALTAPYLWLLSSLAVVPAVLFWRSTPALVFFVLLFAVVYVWLYFRIVLFQTPRRFILRKPDADGAGRTADENPDE